MKLVIIESPYAGDVKRNEAYAKECMLDCLKRDEAPFVSHLLYTQVLDDTIPEQRKLGIEAGISWYNVAEKSVVYTDHGISKGMQLGIDKALSLGREIEYRLLYGDNETDKEEKQLPRGVYFI